MLLKEDERAQLALQNMEKVRHELIITTEEQEQYDILARITYVEQDNGNRKKIVFELVGKIVRGTEHNWHKFFKGLFFRSRGSRKQSS